MRSDFYLPTLCATALLSLNGLVHAQWSNALPMSEDGSTCDTVSVAASKNGGFHAVWRQPGGVAYRQYVAGALQPKITVFNAGFTSGPKISEALNGDVHVVFENWVGNPAPQIGWCRSTNGGAGFSAVINLSATAGCAKLPQITPFGTASSADMLMSYYRSGSTGGCGKQLYYSRFNGTAWSAEADTGSNSLTEYDCQGQGWSPLDGSVFRTFASNNTTAKFRRYSGTWGPETTWLTGTWTVRQRVAVNAAGQMMVLWDDNGRIKSQLYTPNNGPGPVIDVARGGYSGSCDVCWIPGTNKFYMVVGQSEGGAFRVTGRYWAGGTWYAEETVMNGLADKFLAYPAVACGSNGQLFCAWQYHWDPGVQIMCSVRTPPAPPAQTGNVSGRVTDQFGQPVRGVTVDASGIEGTVTDIAGNYSITIRTGSCILLLNKNFYTPNSASGVPINPNATTTRDFTMLAPPPSIMSSLSVTPANTRNTIAWQCPNSANLSGVMIRYKTSGYPLGPGDGTLLLDQPAAPGSSGSFNHTGLTNGAPVYYAAFTYFQDASRHYPGGVVATGTPFGPADFDHDGDVDQTDFGHFQRCLTGSAVPQNDPACLQARLDGDEDVDLNDFGVFQGCMRGPNVPADPGCAG